MPLIATDESTETVSIAAQISALGSGYSEDKARAVLERIKAAESDELLDIKNNADRNALDAAIEYKTRLNLKAKISPKKPSDSEVEYANAMVAEIAKKLPINELDPLYTHDDTVNKILSDRKKVAESTLAQPPVINRSQRISL